MYKVKDGCPGCGACRDICPVDAIIPGTGLAVKITDTCIDCGICVAVCPVNLIVRLEPSAVPTMVGSRKSTGVKDTLKGGVAADA